MRVYYSEKEWEWSKSTGTHYGAKVKMNRSEYEALCKKAGTNTFGYPEAEALMQIIIFGELIYG